MHADRYLLDLEYPLELSIISGALYQRVATYSVRNPVWSCVGSATLARPKSQIYTIETMGGDLFKHTRRLAGGIYL